MATYATFRHIELDNVGYSKKRVRNNSSDIFGGGASPMPTSPSQHSAPAYGNHVTPLREQRAHQNRLGDSFSRLFGPTSPPPEPASIRRQSITRNPVTGDGVESWDSPRPLSRSNTPRMKRNPVTGEDFNSPSSNASSPGKPITNGHAAMINGQA